MTFTLKSHHNLTRVRGMLRGHWMPEDHEDAIVVLRHAQSAGASEFTKAHVGVAPTVVHETNPTDDPTVVPNTLPLFVGTLPRIDDINQGLIGDCWILAELAGLADKCAAYLACRFQDNGDGTISMFVFDAAGAPWTVIVDRLLATDLNRSPGCCWPEVCEKVIAFIRNTATPAAFAKINLGNSDETAKFFGAAQIRGFMNAIPMQFYVDQLNTLYSVPNIVITLPTNESGIGSDRGIVGDHYYTFLGWPKVRNAWGLTAGVEFPAVQIMDFAAGPFMGANVHVYPAVAVPQPPENTTMNTITLSPSAPTALPIGQYSAIGGFKVENNGADFGGSQGPGSFVEWTVNAAAAGSYILALNAGVPSSGAVAAVKVNGVQVATKALTTTGGWNPATQNILSAVNLPAGTSIVRIESAAQAAFNFAGVSLTPNGAPVVPVNPDPNPPPRIVTLKTALTPAQLAPALAALGMTE